MNIKKRFLNYCENKNFEINQNQLKIIDNLNDYYSDNFKQSFFKTLFKNKDIKLGFYLVGDVGVGKTMILNFFYDNIKEKKLRLHFNEFMIQFHDFIFQNQDKLNGIDSFVKDLAKKAKLIYFDEFQVTNIADAMILGKLFKKIFDEKIKVIFSSNIEINDLYKDGLQREQFIPFIDVLKIKCLQKELLINEDYRLSKNQILKRFLNPINQSTNFKLNKFFRKITKNKKKQSKILNIKGRKLIIEDYYIDVGFKSCKDSIVHKGVSKFNFDDLCNKNLGAEDYIEIAKITDFMIIENLPNFNENNSNQQQRFITLIDIIYEKNIPILVTSKIDLNLIESTSSMREAFKRTISRLFELTSKEYETEFF